jgi:ceramide glucosyltransferase
MLLTPHTLAKAVELLTTGMTLVGMGFMVVAIASAQAYLRFQHRRMPAFTPGVSILKSLKGLDPGMLDAFRSHCRQKYVGEIELLFGVASLDDPAVGAVEQLKQEYPEMPIRLVECPERLGANGKVSTLAQMAEHARHDYLLINDSDITVSPHYVAGVMARFAPAAARKDGKPQRQVGLVTALYRGKAHGTLASRFEALGISTDFMAGVLVSRLLEGGLRYGLGSTLAVSREALEKSGGLLALVDHLADDYELGTRVDRAGYRVALSAEVVETAIPPYDWRGFFDHQLRWMRTVRDARPGGYAGLVMTHGLCWAILNFLVSGMSPLSLGLLGLSYFLRLSQAVMIGTAVLGDQQVLASLWLVPLRDVVAMGLWVAGLGGDTIVWRGERFALKDGRLSRKEESAG